jgi:hypothetical protein
MESRKRSRSWWWWAVTLAVASCAQQPSVSSSPLTVSRTSPPTAVQAEYYVLTVILTGPGGAVDIFPGPISCRESCAASFKVGTTVSLTTTTLLGGVFAGWTGACSGLRDCVITMNSSSLVSAHFALETYALTIDRTGPGTITSDPPGLVCAQACSGTFAYGTTVVLSAAAEVGAAFTGWEGECRTSDSTCRITMDGARTAVARFTTSTFEVSVLINGGVIDVSPPGLYCLYACSADLAAGSRVMLTAKSTSHTFLGWGGDCSGAQPICELVLDSNKHVTGRFVGAATRLLVERTGSGTVTSMVLFGDNRVSASPGGNIAGIRCGDVCSALFSFGEWVSLTATPDDSYVFGGWGGACSGQSTCVVYMNAEQRSRLVSARFELR